MHPKQPWPALRAAIYEMQMDNGYSDEAGALRALAYAEQELPAVDLMFTEQWLAGLSPEARMAACAGEEQATTPSGTTYYNVIANVYVLVPTRAHKVLNYLFDVM